MRILFTRFPLESRFGGAEVQTLSLMQGFMERGHEVSFLGSCPVLLAQCKALGIGVKNKELRIGLPPVTKMHSISFFWRRWRMKTKLIAAIENIGNLDAVFMLSLTEKLLLTAWCRDRGMKVIWVEHDRVGRWLTWNPWLPMLRALSAMTTTVVVSNMSTDLYRSLGWKGPIVAIPNGIDTSIFEQKKPCNEQRTDGILRIGCVARLTYDKGVDVLIEALKDIPDIHLTIIGSGREEKKIRSLLKENLQGTSYHLQTSHPDIAGFYRSIDLLVLPSRDHDPFGLVVAEAMAAGVPTICTDACGIASYLNPEDCMVATAGSTGDLRAAILRMQNPALRKKYAEAAVKTVQEKFSLKRMVDEYANLL